jgi:uncharacterized protein (TIGR00730 family)
MTLKRIAVFCSVSSGNEADYLQAAKGVGEALAQRGITLIYGGGKDGMAGALVSAALGAGGDVIGVMPRFQVEKGKAYSQLKDLRIAKDLHDHKAIMAELGDGFIALPGGLGTLEEFFEILTWAQLGIHHKPCGLLNINGFFDKLLIFMDHILDKQFISQPVRDLLLTAEEPDEILDLFKDFSSRTAQSTVKL